MALLRCRSDRRSTHLRHQFLWVVPVLLIGLESAHAQSTQSTRARLTAGEISAKVSAALVTITTDSAQGSGVIIEPSGVIVTNLHVLRGAGKVSVELSNGDIYDDVSIIDVDARKDLLLVKIKAVDLRTSPLANSDKVAIGDRVFVIGSPKGLQRTVSDGLISAIRDSGDGYRLFQTNAAISPGSSGGGMFNEYGELIGVVSAKMKDGENLNFALPVNYVRGILATRPTMTLAELVQKYGRDDGSARRKFSDTSRPTEDDAAALEQLLRQTGFQSVIKAEDGWKVSFSGDHATIHVYLTIEDGMVITSSLVSSNYSDSSALFRDLLHRSYNTNYAKIGVTDKGTILTLNETELRLLDVSALKAIVRAVAHAADDTFAVVTSSASTDVPPIVGPPPAAQLKTIKFSAATRQYSLRLTTVEGGGHSGSYDDAVRARLWGCLDQSDLRDNDYPRQ